MKILISGGRQYLREIPEDIRIQDATFFKQLIKDLKPYTLIHGGARGADFHFAAVAAITFPDLVIIPVIPDWDMHGQRAALIRNLKMLDMLDPTTDSLVAFHGWNGTSHTIANAKKRGINIYPAPSRDWFQKRLFP
jgi:hypothetical protein